ncbi:DsbA family protein [Actinoplanes sp. KI2]|uniref:DsbA family oxidoreductase n=1 Tax=Actinoplanes sp. KI2 TaxID=2983315 RepID=UPI0021D59155|nr:DsbA family protein [Actinoplanes sp. KI2]MCU7731188.1 DsbA family protein [Actinoplanes sp. KI2]
MQLIVYGDFNCPYSYLASQRTDVLQRLGHRVDWRAVEHDPQLSMTGTPSAADAGRWRRELTEVGDLALPGKHAPTNVPALISNTYAATSAYAEALTDGIADQLRRNLFHAVWLSGAHLSNAYDVRPLIAALTFPHVPVRSCLGLELPRPGLGNPDPAQPSRMLGGTIAPTGAPLTTTAWRRITSWRHDWLALGIPVLPTVVDSAGTARSGVEALTWLAGLLPGRRPDGPRTDRRSPAPANRTPEPAGALGADR